MMRRLCCRYVDGKTVNAAVSARTKLGALHADEKVPNQDAHFVTRGANEEVVVGVFDGHGERGHEVAQFASSCMSKYLLARLDNGGSSLKSIVSAAFAETAQAVKTNPCADTSGTTATVLVLRKDECVLAHVGDSCGVLYQRGLRKLTPRFALRPHRPGLCKTEDSRVAAFGGICHDGYVVDQVTRKKGIAVTRTLGDKDMLVNGCIPEPEIMSFRILSRDTAIVIASDGLWDAVGVNAKSVAAVVEANLGKDVDKVCDAVLNHAGNQPFDDCTVIVVELME